MDQVIITAALTGAVTPKVKNVHISTTPEEIVVDAYAYWEVGAAMVYLHMRVDDDLGAMDKERSQEATRLIRSHQDCDVIINYTSSGASAEHPATDEERMAHHQGLEGIEIGSYDTGTFNWMPGGVFMNSLQFLEKLGDLYLERGIKPEVEIFDASMLGITDYFVKQGHLSILCHYQLCLGVLSGIPATVENLAYLVRHPPKNATWSVFGVEKSYLPVLYATLALGGRIRVGLEDNIHLSKGVPATNVQLVERAVQAVRIFGKQPATPVQAREILGLESLKQQKEKTT